MLLFPEPSKSPLGELGVLAVPKNDFAIVLEKTAVSRSGAAPDFSWQLSPGKLNILIASK